MPVDHRRVEIVVFPTTEAREANRKKAKKLNYKNASEFLRISAENNSTKKK